MIIPGIEQVDSLQTEQIERLGTMLGTSFMEERWTRTMLDALDCIGASFERKLEISQALSRFDMIQAAQHNCCHTTSDEAGCCATYLKSELGDIVWASLENESFELLKRSVLSPDEASILEERMVQMEDVSNFTWEDDAAQGGDYVHFPLICIDREKRGSGAFRRLICPILEFADERGVPCFLECYSPELEQLYGHFGFETIRRIDNEALGLSEYCLRKNPIGD